MVNGCSSTIYDFVFLQYVPNFLQLFSEDFKVFQPGTINNNELTQMKHQYTENHVQWLYRLWKVSMRILNCRRLGLQSYLKQQLYEENKTNPLAFAIGNDKKSSELEKSILIWETIAHKLTVRRENDNHNQNPPLSLQKCSCSNRRASYDNMLFSTTRGKAFCTNRHLHQQITNLSDLYTISVQYYRMS